MLIYTANLYSTKNAFIGLKYFKWNKKSRGNPLDFYISIVALFGAPKFNMLELIGKE